LFHDKDKAEAKTLILRNMYYESGDHYFSKVIVNLGDEDLDKGLTEITP
jgi:hypothetical protein